jgi:predicted HTH domain antitoxin
MGYNQSDHYSGVDGTAARVGEEKEERKCRGGSVENTGTRFLEAELYASEGEVVQEALRHLLHNRPDLRIALAVRRYQTDEALTLAKAAALAGVSLERMKEILVSRGISLRLGPATLAEAQAEVVAVV